MKKVDVIIVGSGPSGLMCASQIKNKKVLILEANSELGGKIKVSGGGRCNVSNNKDINLFLENVVKNEKFLYSTLNNMSSQELILYFESRGLNLKEEDNNRMFPQSNKSSDVVNFFYNMFSTMENITYSLNTLVTKVEIKDNLFYVNDEYVCSELVFATGGVTYPHLSQGNIGHDLLCELGHSITDLKPSEAPMISNDSIIVEKLYQGITLIDSKIQIFIDKKKKHEFCDNNVLFTHFGISGPLALKASHYVKEAVSRDKKVFIRIYPGDDIPKRIQDEFKGLGYIDINIVDIKGFNTAFLTNGGVKVKDVNNKTYQSKISENLYIIGEVLDINAYTGGYNIALCFSEGYTCGNFINKRM